MTIKSKTTKKPSLPPFFRQFIKVTQARSITLHQLRELGYEPSGRSIPFWEDKGRSELIEICTEGRESLAGFSLLYCASAGFGVIHPATYTEFLERISPETEVEGDC